MYMDIHTLPKEIVRHIFEYLPPVHMKLPDEGKCYCEFEETSKFFRVEWEYRLKNPEFPYFDEWETWLLTDLSAMGRVIFNSPHPHLWRPEVEGMLYNNGIEMELNDNEDYKEAVRVLLKI